MNAELLILAGCARPSSRTIPEIQIETPAIGQICADRRPPRKLAGAMSLSSEEVERYARQIVLHGVGGPGQNKLKAGRALVVGAGGLGSPALVYLAAAGLGTLGIVDDDEVALSNLHRQIIHGTGDVGRPKTESAAEAIARINPHVSGRADPRAARRVEARGRSSGASTSSSTARTISPRATHSPTPATSSAGRSSPPRSASSTAR